MPLVPWSTWSRLEVTRDVTASALAARSVCRQPMYQAVDDIGPSTTVPISQVDAYTHLAACVASMNLADAIPSTDYGRFELQCFIGSVTLVTAAKLDDGEIVVSGEAVLVDEEGAIPLSVAQALLQAAHARAKDVNGL